jgi:alcohol dehydrogenase class IV
LQRYDEVAQIITGNRDATAQEGVAWVQRLCDTLRIPALSAYGMSAGDLPDLVDKSAVASSMQANPLKLTHDEMHEMLMQAL